MNKHKQVTCITVQNLKPRNPFVATAINRRAGSHRKPWKAQRAQARLALRRGDE